MPSFVIILIIAALIKNLLKFAGVSAFLQGVRPAVVAMIFSTGILLGLNTMFSLSSFCPDFKAIAVFLILCIVHFIFKKMKKTSPPPIMMILLSAVIGIMIYA